MNTISLAIYSAPEPGGSAETALRLAETLMAQGRNIFKLFFFSDGVLNCVTTNEENEIAMRWSLLARHNQIDAVACVSSAQKRGINIHGQPSESEHKSLELLPGFTIGGLAQLMEAALSSDRLLSFSD